MLLEKLSKYETFSSRKYSAHLDITQSLEEIPEYILAWPTRGYSV